MKINKTTASSFCDSPPKQRRLAKTELSAGEAFIRDVLEPLLSKHYLYLCLFLTLAYSGYAQTTIATTQTSPYVTSGSTTWNVSLNNGATLYGTPATIDFNFAVNNAGGALRPGCCNGNSSPSIFVKLYVNGTLIWGASSPNDDNTESGDVVVYSGTAIIMPSRPYAVSSDARDLRHNVRISLPNVGPITSVYFTFVDGADAAQVRLNSLVATSICGAGTTAPTLSATSKGNVCPATTVDLSTITVSNKPAGITLTWHTGTPATTANKISNITALATGATYYAAFYDATNACYSGTGSATTPVTATVTVCVGPPSPTITITSPVNVTTTNTNPPISGTATALASVTVTGPNGQSCVTAASSAGDWSCTSLTFTVGSQTVTAVASTTAGVSLTATDTFTVVSPCATPSVGGTAAYSGGTVCNTTNAGTITLSGQTGSVVKWQTSTDSGSFWTDIASSSGKNYYSFINAANGQQYRAVVNSGTGCLDANSTPVTILTSASVCAIRCTVLPGMITK